MKFIRYAGIILIVAILLVVVWPQREFEFKSELQSEFGQRNPTGRSLATSGLRSYQELRKMVGPRAKLAQRRLSGPQSTIYNQDPLARGRLRFVNSYNPQWAQLATAEFLKFSPVGTQVRLRPQESLIQVGPGPRARLVEVVNVEFDQTARRKTSRFTAMIDSGSGQLLQSWNQDVCVGPAKDRVN